MFERVVGMEVKMTYWGDDMVIFHEMDEDKAPRTSKRRDPFHFTLEMVAGDEAFISPNLDLHLGRTLEGMGCRAFCDHGIGLWRAYRARRSDGG